MGHFPAYFEICYHCMTGNVRGSRETLVLAEPIPFILTWCLLGHALKPCNGLSAMFAPFSNMMLKASVLEYTMFMKRLEVQDIKTLGRYAGNQACTVATVPCVKVRTCLCHLGLGHDFATVSCMPGKWQRTERLLIIHCICRRRLPTVFASVGVCSKTARTFSHKHGKARGDY